MTPLLVRYLMFSPHSYMPLIGMSDVSHLCTHFLSLSLNRGIPLAFGLLLLLVALIKASTFWKLKAYHGSRLVKVLMTDQIVYFAA